MPLQDKSRPDRKQKRIKVAAAHPDTGQTEYLFDSVQNFAETYGIEIQIAYNIIRRKQVYHGLIFRYMDDAERTDRTEQVKSGTERANTNRNETEVHNHD